MPNLRLTIHTKPGHHFLPDVTTQRHLVGTNTDEIAPDLINQRQIYYVGAVGLKEMFRRQLLDKLPEGGA